MRLSTAREAISRFPRSTIWQSTTPASPTRIPRSVAPARLLTPMSTQRSVTLTAFSFSSFFIRWMGFLPTTPTTSPLRVRKRMRCPTSTCGSHPPIPSM